MRGVRIGVLLVSVMLSTGHPARAACDPSGVDAADLTAARAAVAASCSCASAPSNSDYKRCAKDVARAVLGNPGCVKAVARCAANSICGRPGAVTCCRTNAGGRTRCKIARDAAGCRAPRDGSACVGAAQSCCDACTASGCTATTSTTTMPPPDVSGGWDLSGDMVSSSCSISPPSFESHLFISQAGTAVSASGFGASYEGTVSAIDLILRQVGLPRPVSCPGGFYDGFLNISGGALEGDGSIAVEQQWVLFPPVSLPGCEPCTVLWRGRMTPSLP